MNPEPLTPALADAARIMHNHQPPPPNTITLGNNAELSITEHDGDYVLHVTSQSVAVTVPLTALDVWALRSLTGDLVLARLNEVAP
jgi:hypothetical protein